VCSSICVGAIAACCMLQCVAVRFEGRFRFMWHARACVLLIQVQPYMDSAAIPYVESAATSNCQLQLLKVGCSALQYSAPRAAAIRHTATHCNTLAYAATHCNTLQHAATHCSTLQQTATLCNKLQHPATHYKTLQHITTPCNTPQRAFTE